MVIARAFTTEVCSIAAWLRQRPRIDVTVDMHGWSDSVAALPEPRLTSADLEHALLHLLIEHDGPVGASVLTPRLTTLGLTGSEPTIGRLLRGLDTRGLTVRVTNRGRLLTEAGRCRLAHLCAGAIQQAHERELVRVVQSTTIDDVIEVLVVRRALEREAARLAAERASADEIARMAATIELQRQTHVGGWNSIEADVDFHLLVAQAARNRALAAAIDLIRRNLRVNAALQALLQQAGHTWIVGHESIFSAIARRSPLEAEQAMLEHIDTLIDDIHHVHTPGTVAERRPDERRHDQIVP